MAPLPHLPPQIKRTVPSVLRIKAKPNDQALVSDSPRAPCEITGWAHTNPGLEKWEVNKRFWDHQGNGVGIKGTTPGLDEPFSFGLNRNLAPIAVCGEDCQTKSKNCFVALRRSQEILRFFKNTDQTLTESDFRVVSHFSDKLPGNRQTCTSKSPLPNQIDSQV